MPFISQTSPINASAEISEADPRIALSEAEAAGYEALHRRDYPTAKAFFTKAVRVRPLTAFRISEACLQAGAPGHAQLLISILVLKISNDPTVGTAFHRFQSCVDKFLIPASKAVSNQLLQQEISSWKKQEANPILMRNIRRKSIRIIFDILDRSEAAFEENPLKTARILLLLSCLKTFSEQPYQNKLRSLVNRLSNEKKLCSGIFSSQKEKESCVETLDLLSAQEAEGRDSSDRFEASSKFSNMSDGSKDKDMLLTSLRPPKAEKKNNFFSRFF